MNFIVDYFFFFHFFEWEYACIYTGGVVRVEAVLVHVCMMHVEARDWCWKSYVVAFLPFLVKHGLSMKLKEHTSDWSFQPGDPLSLPS